MIRFAAACGLLCAIGGCRALPDAPTDMGPCGVALAVWVRDVAHARYLYYTVEDGELAVGGGVDGLNRSTRWRMALDAEQCARIAAIVRDSQWSATPPVPPEESAVRVDISYRLPDERGEIVTSDAERGVANLIAALDELAAKRFEPALDRLPDAGPQKRR